MQTQGCTRGGSLLVLHKAAVVLALLHLDGLYRLLRASPKFEEVQLQQLESKLWQAQQVASQCRPHKLQHGRFPSHAIARTPL